MKRHPAMAANICPGSKGESPESLATQISAARPPTGTVQHLELTAGEARVRASGPPATKRTTHTLLLSGSLDRSSTHTLEGEIERLCESGVRAITLDLAQLAGIDFAGVAVVAFRRKWCRRRGCVLSLTRATPEIRRAFEAASAGELLGGEHTDAPVEAPDAPLDAADATNAPADQRIAAIAANDPSARIIAVATPTPEAGTRIVARCADHDPHAAAQGTGDTPPTPMEEADAATV
ncbi:MAG TPA: STAS domain-containing protein [Solirubrobacteraceae bacterium]|jgi:anti-anti-sigma factor|nr:STAS domain-containing protein [Solirubrobacteraceae bacterium]